MPTKQRGELIVLATGATKTDNTLVIQVLRAGAFTDMNGKDFELDAAALAEFATNSNALLQSQQIPTQIGHPEDPGAPASGWYKRFFTKVVEGVEWLCAEVELTKVGVEALAENLYKYFSAELYTSTKEIIGGGFVNYPAVGGQQVVGTLALSAYLHPKETRVSKNNPSLLTSLKRALFSLLQLEMSHEQISRELWEALRAKYGDPMDEYGAGTPWIVETYADHVVVEKGGDFYWVEYSIDADSNVTLSDGVPAKRGDWTKKEASDGGVSSLSQHSHQGGETIMPTEAEKIEAARKDEREKLAAELRDQEAKIEAARKDERTRVLAEAARKDEVRALSAKLTSGKHAFPQTPDELEAVLLQLSDADRALITPVLEKLQLSGLVDLGERGHSLDTGAKKQLPAILKTALSEWKSKGETVARFFEVNPELGGAAQYDLTAFDAAN